MIFEAAQQFSLTHPGGQSAALAFVQSPALALSQVRMLRNLHASSQEVSGELVVNVPVIGEIDLPFRSTLEPTEQGANLLPCLLTGERAWVELAGQARAEAGAVSFDFQFRAHLTLPEGENWGSNAFEKMVRAAATRTLERVTGALPKDLEAAMHLSEKS